MGSAAPGEYGGFVSAFESIQVEVPRRNALGKFWGLKEMITDKSKAPNKVIDQWLQPLIERALVAKAARGAEKMATEEGSLVDHMADTMEDVTTLRDEVGNSLRYLAGARNTNPLLVIPA